MRPVFRHLNPAAQLLAAMSAVRTQRSTRSWTGQRSHRCRPWTIRIRLKMAFRWSDGMVGAPASRGGPRHVVRPRPRPRARQRESEPRKAAPAARCPLPPRRAAPCSAAESGRPPRPPRGSPVHEASGIAAAAVRGALLERTRQHRGNERTSIGIEIVQKSIGPRNRRPFVHFLGCSSCGARITCPVRRDDRVSPAAGRGRRRGGAGHHERRPFRLPVVGKCRVSCSGSSA